MMQLLKFNSKSGPLDLFPDWNAVARFTNLSFDEFRDKDFEVFTQAVVLILSISGKPHFMERVKCIELFKSFYDGIVNKMYLKRDQEMKNIILEIVRNAFVQDCRGKADKLNSLFRNRNFNMLEFILMLFEPIFSTNVAWLNPGKYNAVRTVDLRVPDDSERHATVQVRIQRAVQQEHGYAQETRRSEQTKLAAGQRAHQDHLGHSGQ